MALFATGLTVALTHCDKVTLEADSEHGGGEDRVFERGRVPHHITVQHAQPGDLVYFNVGGKLFQAPREVLARAPPASILRHLDNDTIWFYNEASQE